MEIWKDYLNLKKLLNYNEIIRYNMHPYKYINIKTWTFIVYKKGFQYLNLKQNNSLKITKNTIPSCFGILASGSSSVPFDMTGAGMDAGW